MLLVAGIGLVACAEFNDDRYAIAIHDDGQIVVLACAAEDIADIDVWQLDDGKVIGDDGDLLIASVGDDQWEVDGEVFQVLTGAQWNLATGVSVTSPEGAPFAAELGDPPSGTTWFGSRAAKRNHMTPSYQGVAERRRWRSPDRLRAVFVTVEVGLTC